MKTVANRSPGSALRLLLLGGVLAGSAADVSGIEPDTRLPPPPVERFQLFVEPPPAPKLFVVSALAEGERLFHQPGDPDSLFTLGGPTPEGQLHLRAAFEVNDVVLRAVTPDFRMDPGDTRQRSAGNYYALDAAGRPYQLRLGARLVW